MSPPTPVSVTDPTLWPTVRRLFDLVADAPEAEQEAMLRQECTDLEGVLDEAVFSEVRALLEADAASEAGDFLGQAAADQAAHLLAEVAPDATGERVGPWQVTGMLGEGGMGVVYRARRADGAYEQDAALKVIGRGLAPPSLVQRFRRERQILAGLTHPNIARLLDGGLSDAGQPYFAMELVEGEPITAYAERHRLSVDERVRLFGDVVDAVTHAHGRLVVHRDLKPSNVLVTESGGSPRAMLLDFGIAKLLDVEGAQTRTAQLLTPEYAAPEQITGGEITTATDVYALGVLLYELLSGRRPHDLEGASPTEWERTVSKPPPPPSVQGQASLGDLEVVVLKALAPEPERRYASADAFGDDLGRYLEGLPVQARSPTVGYRTRSFVRRHPIGVAAATAFVALLIGFSAVTAIQAGRLADERDRAEEEAATVQAINEFVLGLFQASDPAQSRGVETTAGELLARGAERAETLNAPPEVRTEYLRTLGAVYLRLGAFEDARPLLVEALELSRANGQAEDLLRSLKALSAVYWRTRQSEESEALAREGIALAEASPEIADSLRIAPYIQLGIVLIARKDYAEAEATLTETLEIGRRLRPGHPLYIAALNNLGVVYEQREQFEQAEAVRRDVLALRREVQGDDHPDTASALTSLAITLADRGNAEGAVRLFRDALAIQQRVLPRPHHNTVNTLRALARHVPPSEAIPLLRDALDQVENLYPPDHPFVQKTRDALEKVRNNSASA